MKSVNGHKFKRTKGRRHRPADPAEFVGLCKNEILASAMKLAGQMQLGAALLVVISEINEQARIQVLIGYSDNPQSDEPAIEWLGGPSTLVPLRWFISGYDDTTVAFCRDFGVRAVKDLSSRAAFASACFAAHVHSCLVQTSSPKDAR